MEANKRQTEVYMTSEERASVIPYLKARLAAFTDAQFGDGVTEIFEDKTRNYGRPSVSLRHCPIRA